MGSGLGTSGTDGAIGEWIYVGDDQNTAYDRGSACWKNITLSYAPAAPATPPAVYHIFSNVPRSPRPPSEVPVGHSGAEAGARPKKSVRGGG